MLELINIAKSYNNDIILKNVTYKFPDTGLFILQGANGSGKSTIMKIIAGQIYKTTGSIISNDSIGYVPEKFNMPRLIRVKSYLASALPYMKLNEIDKLMVKFMLPNKKIGELSKGNMLKVALAHILALDTKIILLDEVLDGLDEEAKKMLKGLIKELSENHLIIMILHEKNPFNDIKPTILEVKDGGIYEKRKKL